MSKSYYVAVPFAGYMSVMVDADSEDEAVRKAMDIPWRMDLDLLEGEPGVDCPEIQEVGVFKHICQGNCCYAPLHDAYAEEE